MPRRHRLALVRVSTFTLAICIACAREPEVAPPAPVTADGPRLLVLVAIDQFPYEYLARFDPLLTGGLRRLLDQGVLFENARYGHAITVTAAGHTTLASGLHPSSSGIVDMSQWLGAGWWALDVQAHQDTNTANPTIHTDQFLNPTFETWAGGPIPPGPVIPPGGASYRYHRENGQLLLMYVPGS